MVITLNTWVVFITYVAVLVAAVVGAPESSYVIAASVAEVAMEMLLDKREAGHGGNATLVALVTWHKDVAFHTPVHAPAARKNMDNKINSVRTSQNFQKPCRVEFS